MMFIGRRFLVILALIPLCLGVSGIRATQPAVAETLPPPAPTRTAQGDTQVQTEILQYLPYLMGSYPGLSPFGLESNEALTPGSIYLQRATELNTGWVRLNNRISWKQLQLTPDGPIQWNLLAEFENELRALNAAGIQPVVIVDDYPHWAVIPTNTQGRSEILPSSCGPLDTAYFDDYARFLRALVARYKGPDYHVHHWELGNEVDVDPSLVPQDHPFGCWGDITDLNYYGGQRYGEMLKVVTPEMRDEDPTVKVWLGGLLLASPNTQDPTLGKPENFLKGVLTAGAGPYFDILPYHWYPSFWKLSADVDFDKTGSHWDPLGGGVIGKAAYLRQVMQQFGVDKPLVLNETALACPNEDQTYWDKYPWCVSNSNNPTPVFFDVSADFLVRSITRALSVDVKGFAWYTLNGPGWRQTGLLNDAAGNTRINFIAYQQISKMLKDAKYVGPVSYGANVEAYAFQVPGKQVHVLWAKTSAATSVNVPAAKFLEAWTRGGAAITPSVVGSDKVISLGISPMYIVRNP